MITKLNRSSYAGWQQHGQHHNNEFQNSDRPSKLLKLKKKEKKKHLCFHTTFLPTTYYCNNIAPRKRSIKGSLLTSRFCKCYGLVNDSWPSSVFNCSCNFNVNWLHKRKNERKWKSFQRKTALIKNKKKRNTSCLKHK